MSRGRKNLLGIRTAVSGVCSCARFYPTSAALPTRIGAQLSMTGDTCACGNSCDLDRERLSAVIRSLRAYGSISNRDMEKFIDRRRFMLLCGDIDRSVAIIGAVSELIRYGVTKIVAAADTPAERDALSQSLELMGDSFGVTSYIPGEYDSDARYTISASIYGFLASSNPELLVIGRDCITKKTNLIRQREQDEPSLSELISKARPVVLASSKKISGGRALAKTCEIFNPIMTFVFSGEVKKLRDAVIYSPEFKSGVPEPKEETKMPEQLCFFGER